MYHSTKKSLIVAVGFVVFASAALALWRLHILDFRSQALWLIFGTYVAIHTARIVNSIVSALRSRRERIKYQAFLAHLDFIMRMPKLLPESESSLNDPAEALSARMFCDALQAHEVDTKLFISFMTRDLRFTYPDTFRVKEPFAEEVRRYYAKAEPPNVIRWTSPWVIGTFLPKSWFVPSVGDFKEPRPRKQTYLEGHASQDFGVEDFCLTAPLRNDYSNNTNTRTRAHGFIGILSSTILSRASIAQLAALVEQFDSLYNRIRGEQLSLLIDEILNRELPNATRIPTLPEEDGLLDFSVLLSNVFQRFFNANRVEVWLRGMPTDPALTTMPLIGRIMNGSIPEYVASTEGTVTGFDFHVDLIIELEGCFLGLVRVLRNTHPFSVADINLLTKVEREIDNYVRDLWRETILTRIDHQVLNHIFPNVTKFAGELIKAIVNELDVDAGLIWLASSDRFTQHVLHTTHDPSLDDELREVVSYISHKASMPIDRGTSYHRIALVVKTGCDEPQGYIAVINARELTNVHWSILKAIEARTDNIILLYEHFPPPMEAPVAA